MFVWNEFERFVEGKRFMFMIRIKLVVIIFKVRF